MRGEEKKSKKQNCFISFVTNTDLSTWVGLKISQITQNVKNFL